MRFGKAQNRKFQVSNISSREGFEQIYNQYGEKIYGIVRSKINNKGKAEGIVHDIFKSLWERRDEIQIVDSLENYLCKAAKLKIIDYYRQKARSKKHMSLVIQGNSISDFTTEREVEYNELQEQITLLLNKLPAKSKNVFELSRHKGLSNKEIASRLLVSEKTVEYHISKALKFLKKNLVNYRF